VWILWMALASNPAMESVLILEQALALSRRGMVLVVTTWVKGDPSRRSMAGPDSTGWVAAAMTLAGALFQQDDAGLTHGAGGVDHVVDDHAPFAGDVTDDMHGLGLIGGVTTFCR